jgi:hypothetical protein
MAVQDGRVVLDGDEVLFLERLSAPGTPGGTSGSAASFRSGSQ